MSMFEAFNTPFLICLGITLIILGVFGMFFNQKITEQNHKISSMVDLVSTMAQELTFLKTITVKGTPPVTACPINNIIPKLDKPVDNILISVSDDEKDSDEESEDDEQTED